MPRGSHPLTRNFLCNWTSPQALEDGDSILNYISLCGILVFDLNVRNKSNSIHSNGIYPSDRFMACPVGHSRLLNPGPQ